MARPGSVATSAGGSCRWKRAQDAHHVGVGAQPLDRAGDRRVAVAALEVEEEHVLAETLPAGAGLDPHEVDAALGELREAAHEPARARRAGAPEHERGL